MRFSALISKSLVAAVVAVFAWSAPAEAAGKVAVIDMVKAMQAHPRTKVVEDKFKKAQETADNTLKAAQEELQKLQREIDGPGKQNPDNLNKQKRFLQLQGAAKFNYEWAMRLAMRDYTQALERIYAAVRGEVGRYADEQKIDVVLHRTSPITPLNSVDAKDFALKTRLRSVVYAAPNTDITEAVIKRFPKPAK